MKNLSLKHFALLLAAALLLFTCRNREREQQQQAEAYKEAITTLLQQDSSVAAANPDDKSALAAGMRRLDLSQCPRDFAVAYVDHMHAWEESGKIQQALALVRSSDVQVKVLIKGGIQKLFGAKYTSIDDLNELEQNLIDDRAKADEQISTTFHAVERLAVYYGATLP